MTARYSSTLSRGLSCAPSKAGDFQWSELERVVLELTERVASMCKNTWTRKPLLGRITLTRVGGGGTKGFRKLWRTYHGCGNFSRVRHRQATRRRSPGRAWSALRRG